MALAEFVDFLDQKNLVDVNKIQNDDDDGFSNRLRIQKYVFLARQFGLELPYNFNMHLHGPYSKSLTQDYYNLPNVTSRDVNSLNDFNQENFLSLLKDKSEDWLEIAATIIHKRETIEEENLLDHVAWIKCDFTGDFIEDVYSDLQSTILQ